MLENKTKIVIYNYPVKIPLTKGRRKQYYNLNNIPKKFLNKNNNKLKEGYSWLNNRLTYRGDLVIKNLSKLETPRYFNINFQSLYNGSMHPQTRSKIVKYLHDYWKSQIKNTNRIILNKNQVVIMFFHYYDIKDNIKPDFIDNFCFLYKKTFMDTLVEMKILENDDIRFVRGDTNLFYEIHNEKERRLDIDYKIVNKITLI